MIMTKMFDLVAQANQFLTQRNWWQFHNPKNDAMNIMVEAGELAEHFIVDKPTASTQVEIAYEMADVLFATIGFALLAKIDIASALGVIAGDQTLKDSDCSYEQLQELVLHHVTKFNLVHLTMPCQVVLSLTVQTSKLADIFVWCTSEQSVARAHEHHGFATEHVACIIAHLVLLSSLLNIDLPAEYAHKMQKNDAKYPIGQSSGEEYIKIKDQSRGR